MEYDSSYKKAQRLLRQAWSNLCAEAHRLAALGLPVTIDRDQVEFGPEYGVTNAVLRVYQDGTSMDGWVKFWCYNSEPFEGQRDYHESENNGGQVTPEALANWLRAHLEAQKKRASHVGSLAGAINEEVARRAVWLDVDIKRCQLANAIRDNQEVIVRCVTDAKARLNWSLVDADGLNDLIESYRKACNVAWPGMFP